MEFDMEWNFICRVCLQEGEMYSLYEAIDGEMTHSEKIMKCSDITIDPAANLPEQICKKCLNNLNIAYNFRLTCERSDDMLKSLIQDSVTNIVVSGSSENVYTYKPPEGLIIKRVKNATEVQVKEELDIIEETEFDPVIVEYLDEEGSDAENFYFIEEESPIAEIVDSKDLGIKLEPNDESMETSMEDGKKRPYRYFRRQKGTKKGKNGQKKPKEKSVTQPVEKPPHICDICGNSYNQRSKLEIHVRRHRNERLFPCEICGKSFFLNVELKLHMRRHTGDKPYSCQYCDRRFTDWGSRLRHERMHTGERPFTCSTCGKAFAYSYGLSNHMLVHTGEKRFLCMLCKKRYTTKHHLKAHLQTHQRRGDYVDIESLLADQPKPEKEPDPDNGNSEDENAVANLDVLK